MENIRSKKYIKTVLRLANIEHMQSAVLNNLALPESRRSYEFAIEDFTEWHCWDFGSP